MQSQTFLDAHSIFDQIDIKPSITAADFGCGPGYFSIELAQRVGSNGHVWALDILPQALESVLSAASAQGIRHIDVRRVNLEKEGGSRFNDASLDFVVVKDMLFQNKDRQAILNEVHRVLKQEAEALIVEWAASDGQTSFGPEASARIKRDEMEKMLAQGRFSIVKPIDAGSFHYAFLVKKGT